MATINVNRNVSDKFYRYKMPPLIAKVEGKGNGIKTVIVNMTEIGRCLSRPATYLTKFFGSEFGAQTKCDVKNDRYIVNGAHECDKLQEALDGFIKKFVLCNECNNPETEFHINTKKQLISQSCKACGYVGTIDPNHKLTAFILKNPNEFDEGKVKISTKKCKKAETNAEENGEEKSDNNNVNDIPNFGGLILEENGKNSHFKKDQNKKEVDAFDDDWAEEEDSLNMKNPANGDNNNNENIDKFYHFIKDLKEKKKILSHGVDKVIFGEAEKLGIKDKASILLVEVLLDQNAMIQIPLYRLIFLRFCHQNPKAQKYLLGALEQLIGKEYPHELMPKAPHIMKTLYDSDILDEETIFEWEAKVTKKYVDKETAQLIRTRCAPFIKWLHEAESEEESGDEDSESIQNGHINNQNGEDSDETDDLIEDTEAEVAKLREKHVKRGALLLQPKEKAASKMVTNLKLLTGNLDN